MNLDDLLEEFKDDHKGGSRAGGAATHAIQDKNQ
jgi:hypothetical protein